MNEPIIRWNFHPQYLDMFLQKWYADNPPIPFLRLSRRLAARNHTKAREPWRLTVLGKSDLWKWKGIEF